MNTDANTSAEEALEFRSSRSKARIVAGGCAAIAAIAAYAAVIAKTLWPWLMVAYFGLGAVAVLVNGLVRPARLRLDARGVDFIHWRHRWSVRWDDIAEVQLVILRINWCRVNANVVLRDKAGVKRTVSSGLTITPDTLVGLIRGRLPSAH